MGSKKSVKVGTVTIGGGAPITIQSMLSKPSADVEGNITEAVALEKAGCQILRVAIPNTDSVKLIPTLKAHVSIPIVADIHFDYRLAVLSAEAGADKIRINPGNIGGAENVKAVAEACRKHGVPIRIGVNSGSISDSIMARFGSVTAEAMVESAKEHVKLLNRFDFDDIVLSLKSSDVKRMLEAYRLAAQTFDYPLHLGVTEAGGAHMGLVRSAVGIGGLLCEGIGDTVRVSLSGDPLLEIPAARDILKAVGAQGYGPFVVSCPTCGRATIDVATLAAQVESATYNMNKDIRISVMGCVVNGPGEAKESDIGITGSGGEGIVFVKGKVVARVPESELMEELFKWM